MILSVYYRIICINKPYRPTQKEVEIYYPSSTATPAALVRRGSACRLFGMFGRIWRSLEQTSLQLFTMSTYISGVLSNVVSVDSRFSLAFFLARNGVACALGSKVSLSTRTRSSWASVRSSLAKSPPYAPSQLLATNPCVGPGRPAPATQV